MNVHDRGDEPCRHMAQTGGWTEAKIIMEIIPFSMISIHLYFYHPNSKLPQKTLDFVA